MNWSVKDVTILGGSRGQLVTVIWEIATLIVDPDGKGLDTHWQKTACALLTGVFLTKTAKGQFVSKLGSALV
jgi:type IV secretion system protein VirD4